MWNCIPSTSPPSSSRLKSVEEEHESNAARIDTLKRELELLAQDNRTLEEAVEEDRRRLEEERLGLEDKATFLHFTQEQLNHQLQVRHS